MQFFNDDDYFTGPALTQDMVDRAEAALGFRLPGSYLGILSQKNGGTPLRRCVRMDAPTSWAPDHIEIAGLRGIGGEWGIDSTDGLGSTDMITEWGYPDVGIVICEMPSGGHDAVMLDYSSCGPNGEPAVVYIDEDRSVRMIAPTFAEFLSKLEPCSELKNPGRTWGAVK